MVFGLFIWVMDAAIEGAKAAKQLQEAKRNAAASEAAAAAATAAKKKEVALARETAEQLKQEANKAKAALISDGKKYEAAILKQKQQKEKAEGALVDERAKVEKKEEELLKEIASIKDAHVKSLEKEKQKVKAKVEREASKKVGEMTELAETTHDSLAKARTQLLKQRKQHRQDMKEITNSEAYLASKFITEKLHELRSFNRHTGSNFSSPSVVRPRSSSGARSGAGGGAAAEAANPPMPYALEVSCVYDARVVGVYVHADADRPARVFNSRPYFQRVGGSSSGGGDCFLSYDVVLRRWVFGSADPLGESKEAELYAVSGGSSNTNAPVFPEHVAVWCVPTVDCDTLENIDSGVGWAVDEHLRVSLFQPKGDGELEVYSKELQAFKFDGLYTPRRKIAMKMCYKRESEAGSGIAPCYLFFDDDLGLWVIGQGPEQKTAQILAASLDRAFADDGSNDTARGLSDQWAVATGGGCTLERESILRLEGGWEMAEVQVFDRTRGVATTG